MKWVYVLTTITDRVLIGEVESPTLDGALRIVRRETRPGDKALTIQREGEPA